MAGYALVALGFIEFLEGLGIGDALIFYDKDEETISKCNLCKHLIDHNLEPACVSTCMTSCRVFGDLDDPDSEVSRLLKEKKEHILQFPVPWGSPAKPNVIYVRKRIR